MRSQWLFFPAVVLALATTAAAQATQPSAPPATQTPATQPGTPPSAQTPTTEPPPAQPPGTQQTQPPTTATPAVPAVTPTPGSSPGAPSPAAAPLPPNMPTVSPGQPAGSAPAPSTSAPAFTPAVGGALPPGATADTLNSSVTQGEPPAGIRELGPVITVSGCLRGTDLGHENEAFTLDATTPAEALTDAQPPQGVNAYRLLGIVPDLRRHVGERVEVIGLIREAAATDGSAPLALDAKSVVATDKCSRQQ
jgi:hypothetical protein